MMTKKLTIAMCLLLTPMPRNAVGLTTGGGYELNKQTQGEAVSVQDINYESRVGWILAGCLIRGCSIFIGTVREVVRPEQQAKSADLNSSSYSKVSMRIDKWVYGEPQQWEHYVQLDQVPIELSAGRAVLHQGDVWRDVKLEVGKRLLVAFSPATTIGRENHEASNRIDRYGLVVSNEKLFPVIQATVSNHSRYAHKPEELLDAPDLLNARIDYILSGYLVYYFWAKGGNENTDIEAAVISQLIGNSHVPEGYWRFLEAPLVRAMTNNDSPVSEATRNQVTNSLIAAGCSGNSGLARSALRVLILVTDSGNIDVEPFLTEERRRKLIRNYKALITAEAVENKQATLESQLGLKSN